MGDFLGRFLIRQAASAVGRAKPPGRANARPMTGSACPPLQAIRFIVRWWARRKSAFAHPCISARDYTGLVP
jgi:hypothetical protein